MQTVSKEWISNQRKTLLGESFVEVSLDITDPDALVDASSQDNGAAYISDTHRVLSEGDKNITPYSTLEQNIWILDGSRKAIPVEETEDSGFVGDILSDRNGGFPDKTPTITIHFTRIHSNPIPAVTITWSETYGEYAEDFVVSAYRGNTRITSKEVRGNKSIRSIVMIDIAEYDRITIHVLRWCLPLHRVRIEKIFLGLNMVYSKKSLFSYNHTQTVDPISTSLPKMEVSFSVDNSDNSYDPYNTAGLSKYLMERQEVKSRYGYRLNDRRIEWIPGGTFYLSEWRAPQNGMGADFTARDLLEFMFNDYIDNAVTISPRNLYDLAEAVLLSANLPLNYDGTRKWVIDESLKNIYTSCILPTDAMANCLLMIANAGNCVIRQNREGFIHIESVTRAESDYTIGGFNSYRKPEIVLSKPVKDVAVKVYQYAIVDGEVKTSNSEVIIPVGDHGERIKVDNPLITDNDRATAVGEWVRDYVKNRITLEVDWRPDVRLDALDVVKIDNDYGHSEAIMTDVAFKYAGAFRGSGKGRVM